MGSRQCYIECKMVAQYEEEGVNGKCGELTMANLGAVRWGEEGHKWLLYLYRTM